MIDNERIVRGFYEEFVNAGDESAVSRFVDPNVEFFFGGQLVGTGPAAFQQMLIALRAAFPDLHTTVEQVVACDDMVCERVLTRGTHLGTLALPGLSAIAATGRKIEMHGISIFQLRDGRIVANWAMPDQLGVLRQIGALQTWLLDTAAARTSQCLAVRAAAACPGTRPPSGAASHGRAMSAPTGPGTPPR